MACGADTLASNSGIRNRLTAKGSTGCGLPSLMRCCALSFMFSKWNCAGTWRQARCMNGQQISPAAYPLAYIVNEDS